MTEKDRKFRAREKEIRVKVTDDELQYAKDKAAYCGMTMSDFVRKQITEGFIIKYERFDIKKLANELNKIGVNINQIAKHVNEKGGEYDRQDIDDLINEFQEMQALIYSSVWGLEWKNGNNIYISD